MQSLCDQLLRIMQTQFKNQIPYPVEWDYVHQDRDILEHDTQAGDLYLWVLKGEEGTWLGHLDGSQAVQDKVQTFLKGFPLHHLFLIRCTDHNQGAVSAVSTSELMQVMSRWTENPYRVPRRQAIVDQLAAFLNPKHADLETILKAINPEPETNTFLKIKPGRQQVDLIVACQDSGEIQVLVLTIPCVYSVHPRCLKVTPSGNGFGVVREIECGTFERIKGRVRGFTPAEPAGPDTPALDPDTTH